MQHNCAVHNFGFSHFSVDFPVLGVCVMRNTGCDGLVCGHLPRIARVFWHMRLGHHMCVKGRVA